MKTIILAGSLLSVLNLLLYLPIKLKELRMQYQWTVKELKEMLALEPDEAKVFAIYHNENGELKERPIYKSSTSADDTEHYLYLGGKTNDRARFK
jgi:hypothetical protein